MRGSEDRAPVLFSYVSLEDRVPRDHPLRIMKKLVDGILRHLSPRFDAMYARVGRPSIPPEQLMRALLLQIFYSVRSERLLMEQLDYNLLFRWFVGLGMDDEVWVPTTFTKNRDRLLSGDLAQAFFLAVREEARGRKLLSDEVVHAVNAKQRGLHLASHCPFTASVSTPTPFHRDYDDSDPLAKPSRGGELQRNTPAPLSRSAGVLSSSGPARQARLTAPARWRPARTPRPRGCRGWRGGPGRLAARGGSRRSRS